MGIYNKPTDPKTIYPILIKPLTVVFKKHTVSGYKLKSFQLVL